MRFIRLPPVLALPTLIWLAASCGSEPAGVGGGVARIEVSPESAILDALGAQDTLVATAFDADGKGISAQFTWSSSDPAVLGVTPLREGGLIEARSNGTATISASSAGVQATATVQVDQSFERMVFSSLPPALLSGGTLALEVLVADRLGSPLAKADGTLSLGLAPPTAVQLTGVLHAPLNAGRARLDAIGVQGSGLDLRLQAVAGGWQGASAPFDVVPAFDRIQVQGPAPGAMVGLLVDGRTAGGDSSDVGFATGTGGVDVGSFRPGARNEVVAFSADGLGLSGGALWSDGPDTVTVSVPSAAAVDVVLWIVKGPFEAQRDWALAAVQRTRDIWASERYGVVIDSVEVVDATADPDASRFFLFDLCGARADAEALIGRRPGAINVYYVERVDGGADRGRTCPVGGDFIVMAERSGDELLSHEIGHAFGMGHVDVLTGWFDQSNIMHSASSQRAYITEGQTFRTHLSPGSALNGALAVRSGVTRPCIESAATTECPRLEARLWADGSFLANVTRFPLGGGGAVATATWTNLAERWLATTCMDGENATLDAALAGQGSLAIQDLSAIAADSRRGRPQRLKALAGLAVVGSSRARSALTRFRLEGDPALVREADFQLSRLPR